MYVHEEKSPADYFHKYSIPVAQWLQKNNLESYESTENQKLSILIKRCKMFLHAFEEYKKASLENGNGPNSEFVLYLRDTCHVVEEYCPVSEATLTWFIFKEDCNGVTYRVFTEKDDKEYKI